MWRKYDSKRFWVFLVLFWIQTQEQKFNEQNKQMKLTLYLCTVTTDRRGYIDGIFYGTYCFVGGCLGGNTTGAGGATLVMK